LKLDDLLRAEPPQGDWLLQGRLRQEPEGVTLRVLASPAFREVVVFTPPHRQALCIEPYTCITDALNLQARGVDAGMQVLPPGQSDAGGRGGGGGAGGGYRGGGGRCRWAAAAG